MKKVLVVAMTTVLSLALFACGKTGTVTQDQFKKLEAGMTKTDVEESLGEPLKKKERKWIYDLEKDDKTIRLTVFFNGDELAGSTTGSKE